ncbi:penicillin-binding transpeptidase domain-containing protein [Clostridium sp. MB40-C1]|uniref:penicillin-binding transpeptidase domain-containing protein n=1 Tax=Clostridium sp. MB40-C1 TaxID=3070996 RepID=UPI0027DEDE09|nr:penicillin-binding transpeptidase domain-containing protein [Clostridium sp. MB40-C1]WMJ81039.1 penicillin-binding transpeptidase domain-containing protein [Clostridium sp. MB40-C1]
MSKFSILERKNKNYDGHKKFNRYTALVVCMLFVFSLIASRLAYLQIVKADEYREETSKRAIRNIPIEPPRGNIIDSKGKVLAESKQGYTLVFTETTESKKEFFNTMIKVFDILDKEKEVQGDNFELKINPFRFEFDSENPKTRKWMELRFKKDRGMNTKAQKKLFGNKKDEELTDDDRKKIDEELKKETAEETYNYLLDTYEISAEEDKLTYTELFKKLKNNNSKEEESLDYYLKTYKISGKDEDTLFKNLYKKMPKDTFDSLIKKYNVNVKKYPLELQRRFMLVKDAIKMQSFQGFKPVEIATNLKRSTAFKFMQKYQELPGIEVTVNPIRVYPNDNLGSSFIGYLSKINLEQKEKYEEKGYDANTDYIGAAGIEGAFESSLKGSKGTKIVQINKYGRIIKELGRKEPYPGKTLQLTIDSALQNTAEQSLDAVMKDLQKQGRVQDVDTTNATRGAAVVIDTKTGKILALASNPTYNPNLFAVPGRLTPELQAQYFNPDLKAFGKDYTQNLMNRSWAAKEAYANKSTDQVIDRLFPLDKSIKNNSTIRQDVYDIYPKPLYNYATKSLVPPGSTFKPLVGLAALEEGVYRLGDTMHDDYMFTENGYKGKDWNTYSFGDVDIVRAIEKSINNFFFKLGHSLFKTGKYNGGFDAIANYAWKFGLGAPKGAKAATGIEIPEKFGQVYNLESGKTIFSALYMNNLLGLLKAGTDARTPNYKPHYIGVDITEGTNDNEDVKKLKEKLRNKIIEEMKNKTKEGTNEIKNMFLQLSNKDANLKKKYEAGYNEYAKTYSGDASKKMPYEKYVSEQLNKAWMASVYTIADAYSNIYNQNNVYDASIGQGTNQFTPLQLASYIATLVNGGTRYKAHLVDKILDQDNKVVKEFKPEVLEKNNFKPDYIKAIKEGMKDVTAGDGTAKSAFNGFPISNGGKTGSATFSKIQDEFGRTSYAVYTGFAPYDDPEISVCVIIFDGGHGGSAAYVARAIYEKYFEERIKKENPGYSPMYNFKIPNNSQGDQEKTESSVDIPDTNLNN